MAIIISGATGNWSSSSSWRLGDSVSFINFNQSNQISNSALTTTYQNSATFTPGAITIDGIGLHLHSITSSPTGTMTVALDQAGSDVAGTIVTINVSDLNSITALAGWHFFKFSSPITLTAATAYAIKTKTSSASQVNITTNTTLTAMCRFLRTTTNQSPTTTDTIIVCGELTGVGTGNNITITNDNTASTIFGAIFISKRGIVTFSTSAGTYLLHSSLICFVTAGGVLNIGSSGTPYPSTCTAISELSPATNVTGGWQFEQASTINIYGATKKSSTVLTADVAAAATVLPVATNTNWVTSDTLIIASTSRTASESESRTISSISGLNVTVPALTNAHEGVNPQGEIINLTRNIKIRGVNTTTQGFVYIHRSTCVIKYAELYNLGSTTVSKRGVEILNDLSTATCTIDNCSFHDSQQSGSGITISTTSVIYNNIITNNVIYNIQNNGIAYTNNDNLNTGSSIVGNIIISCATSSFTSAINLNAAGDIICTDNVCIGQITNTQATFVWVPGSIPRVPVLDRNTVHSTAAGGGFSFGSAAATSTGTVYFDSLLTIDSIKSFRNVNGPGIGICLLASYCQLTFTNCTSYGNTSSNINIPSNYLNGVLTFKGLSITFDTKYSIGSFGISISNVANNTLNKMVIIDSTISGMTSGSIQVGSVNYALIECYNTIFSTTPVTGFSANNIVKSQKHNGTAGNYATYRFGGVTTRDTIIFNSSPSSIRYTLANTNSSTEVIGSFKAAVINGVTYTASIMVRKSITADGTNYAGSQPQLIVRANPSAGIYSDTVIGTAVSANGVWENISGTITPTDTTILEFAIQVAHSTVSGWVNIDDFSITPTVNSALMENQIGEPVVLGSGSSNSLYSRSRIVGY
jgi:hypothetical protein